MTAEIAILNKEAVALAADSAVTLADRQGQKIFPSANKIFSLSKSYPVAAMIYGSSVFMEIPWETIIKVYREKRGGIGRNTLEEYARDFLDFLKTERVLSPEREQKRFVETHVSLYVLHIMNRIKEAIAKIIESEGEINEDQVFRVTVEVIKDEAKSWDQVALIKDVPQTFLADFKKRYGQLTLDVIGQFAEELPLPKASVAIIEKIVSEMFMKSHPFPGHSGLVIAGFGTEDLFPCLYSFLIDGIGGDFLKYIPDTNVRIDIDMDASINPFAQREMVNTFMEGVDPDYEKIIETLIFRVYSETPGEIVESLTEMNDTERDRLKEKLSKWGVEKFQETRDLLTNYRYRNFVDPVIKVVGMLPKDELAAMAEALVSLTSFKRKVSLVAETVGGPIDVAVISKGDGLVWIKRKHYFQAELNQQFLRNYFREVKRAKTDEK